MFSVLHALGNPERYSLRTQGVDFVSASQFRKPSGPGPDAFYEKVQSRGFPCPGIMPDVKNTEGASKERKILDIAGALHHDELPRPGEPRLLRRDQSQEIIAGPEVPYLLDFELFI